MPQLDTMTLVTSIILGIACIVVGTALGALPIQKHKMTEAQEKLASIMSFVVAMVFLVMMMNKQDLSTWVMLIALAVGFGIGKIPPVHQFFIDHWAFFVPRQPRYTNKKKRR